MKLHLPKALITALLAGMVGNVTVSELRAESIESSTYASLLTENLVYANSFNAESAEVGGITFTNSAAVADGYGTIQDSNKMKATGLGDTLGANGFTISFDILNYKSGAWADLLCITTNNKTDGSGGANDIQIQMDNSGSFHAYVADNFAGASGKESSADVTIWTPENRIVPQDRWSQFDDLQRTTLTVVYNAANNTISTYINGAETGNITMINPTSENITGIFFGTASDGSSRGVTYTSIDNLSIWKTALTAEQVGNTLIHKTWTEGESYSWAEVSPDKDTWGVLNVKITATDDTADTANVSIADSKTVSITDLSVTGGSLTMSVEDGSSLTIANTHFTTDASLTLAGGGTISLTGDIDTLGAQLGVASGTGVTLGENALLTIGASTLDNQGTLTLTSGAKFVLDGSGSFNVGSLVLGDGSGQIRDYVVVSHGLNYAYSGGIITVDGEATSVALTWNGTEENNVWVADCHRTNWTSGDVPTADYFAEGDTVTFGAGDGIHKTVAVSGNVRATSMTVSADYTFTGGSIATDTLTVNSASLTVNDDCSIRTTTLNTSGTVTLSGSIATAGLNIAGTTTLESSMSVDTLSMNGATTLRLGVENQSVSLTVGAGLTTANDYKIELGKGAALEFNGRLAFGTGITGGSTITIGTIGSTLDTPDTREGDYGSVTVQSLQMASGGNGDSTLNILANAALNITKAGGSLSGDASSSAFLTNATLLLCHWNSDSITNVYGTLNALNCEYLSVINATYPDKKVDVHVYDGGVINIKGLILQRRDNDDRAKADIYLEDGARLNIGSAGIAKKQVQANCTSENKEHLYIHMGSGVTLGIIDGTEGWTSDYDFIKHSNDWNSSFDDTIIDTQHYIVATDGRAGSSAATGGTITLTGSLSGSFTKKGLGTLDIQSDNSSSTVKATVNGGTLKLSGSGNLGDGSITVGAGATLELAHTAATATANAITLNGNLVVSGSGVETLSGTLTGTAQSLKVGTNGGLVLNNGQQLTVTTYAKTGSVVLNNGAILKIDAIASNDQPNDIYSPVSGGDGTGRLIISLGEGSDWKTSNIVSLAEGTKLKDVTVVGEIALSQFGLNSQNQGLGSTDNQTNLQGNDLRMTDEAKLVIRAVNGGNGNMGDILLEGTATIDAYGYNGTVTLGNDIKAVEGLPSGTVTKLVKGDDGAVTLTGDITLNSLSVTKGALNIGGTLALSGAFSVASEGAMTMESGSTIDLDNWAFTKTGNAYAFTITNNAEKTTINEGVIWSLAGGTYANGVYTWTATGDHVVNNNQSFAWGTDNYLGGESSAEGATNNVQFVGTSTVTLASNVESADSTIGAGAKVTVVKNGHSLTATNLTLDGTLKLTSKDTLANGTNFASGSTGVVEVAWTGNDAIEDAALLTALNGSGVTLHVAYGTRLKMTDGKTINAVVEDGGHIRLESEITHTGNITITGNGLAGGGTDTLGALKFSREAKLVGNVTIAGGSAVIATWGDEPGTIEGAINGEDADSTLRFLNNHTSDQNSLTVTNGLSKISEVEVERGTMTVYEAATNAGETFTKSGAGTLAVQSISSGESGAAGNVAVEAGTLKLTGETTVAAGKTVTLGTAGTMTAGSNASLKSVSLESNGNITGLESLGEMSSVSLTFAADTSTSISNVTMTDTVLSGGSVNLGNNVTAVVSYATAAEPATSTGMPLFGDSNPGSATADTLNATTVMQDTTATGALTVDVTSGLLTNNTGKTLVWTILDNVTIDSNFALYLGDVLNTIVGNGKPEVTLSGSLVTGGDPIVLGSGNISNGLYTGGLITGTGNLVLTISNIPEPTTGTLSVLALAALALRRRRK